MIKVAGIGILFFLLFALQRILYERLWQKQLHVHIAFSREQIWEGQEGELKEVIESRKRLPLSMLKVKFKTDRHLIFADQKGSRTTDQFYRNDIFRIGSNERVTRLLKFRGGRRGYYTIEGASLVASDLFLTSQMVADVGLHTALYVYPRPYESPEFIKSLALLNGEVLSKRHLLEDPFEYRGIREYQPYDDIRSINWKATARTDELKVNQKSFTALKSVRIFLNAQDDNIMKKEECVEAALRIAAALCSFFLAQGIQVSCYGNAKDCLTGKTLAVDAKAGKGQLDNILRSLARLDLDAPVADFRKLFEETLFCRSGETITCFVSPNQYESYVRLLEKYQAAGNAFVWFYPVQGSHDPELPEKLAEQIRLIHLDR